MPRSHALLAAPALLAVPALVGVLLLLSAAAPSSALAQSVEPPTLSRPIVAGWRQADNEALLSSLRRGVVPTVRVSGDNEVWLQPKCNLLGRLPYRQLPMSSRRFERRDLAHVRSTMSFGAFGTPTLAAPNELLTLVLGYRGQYRMEWESPRVPVPESVGKCYAATHYVRAATVGAYAVVASRGRDLPPGAYGWGVIDKTVPLGPGQRIAAARGSRAACEQGTDADCSTVLSVELVRIVRDGCRLVLDRDIEVAPGESVVVGECDCTDKETSAVYMTGRVTEDCARRGTQGCTTAGVQHFWVGTPWTMEYAAPGGARTYLNEPVSRNGGCSKVEVGVRKEGGCGPDKAHLGPCRFDKGLTLIVR